MRVIAGKARRIRLKTVPGMDIRPTTDRIKETLFNMLAPDLYDCRFMDLFSGSGAIGIEALSRQAACAYFVDNNRKAVECIEANLRATGLTMNAHVVCNDVIGGLNHISRVESAPFDLIFMDPPYKSRMEFRTLEYLKDSHLVNMDTKIIIEADIFEPFDEAIAMGFKVIKEKIYKTNKHVFLTLDGVKNE